MISNSGSRRRQSVQGYESLLPVALVALMVCFTSTAIQSCNTHQPCRTSIQGTQVTVCKHAISQTKRKSFFKKHFNKLIRSTTPRDKYFFLYVINIQAIRNEYKSISGVYEMPAIKCSISCLFLLLDHWHLLLGLDFTSLWNISLSPL